MEKRKAQEDIGREEPAPKRQRTGPYIQNKDKITELPPEIRRRIVQNLIDPVDLLESIRSIESLRRTSNTFNQDINSLIRDPSSDENEWAPRTSNPDAERYQKINRNLEDAERKFVAGKSSFGDFPIAPLEDFSVETGVVTRAESRVRQSVFRCETIPLESKSEKSAVVRDIMSAPDGPLKYAGIDRLALNVGFLEPQHRTAIVQIVCGSHEDARKSDLSPPLGGAAKSLVERMEYLSRSDQEKLLDAVLATPDGETTRDCIEALCSKAHLIESESSRDQIIRRAFADAEDRAFRLALAAENLGRLPTPSRELAAEKILSLDRNEPGRLWALSKLVCNLDSLSPQICNNVLRATERELEENSAEPLDDRGARWYTDPSICRGEIAYHLFNGELSYGDDVLTERISEKVQSFVDTVFSRKGSLIEKAQFLPNKTDESRDRFVRKHLPWSLTEVSGDADKTRAAIKVVQGMSLRIEDLNDREKRVYSRYSVALPRREAEKVLEQNIASHMDHFEWTDQNRQVRKQIQIRLNSGNLEGAADTLGHVARQAGLLDQASLKSVVHAAETFSERFDSGNATSDQYRAIRSIIASTAQSVANSSLADLIKGGVDLQECLEPQRAQEMAKARQIYDYRDRSANRDR